MLSYEFQLYMKIENNKMGWRSIRPSNEEPYRFYSTKQAWDVMTKLYPDTNGANMRTRISDKSPNYDNLKGV